MPNVSMCGAAVAHALPKSQLKKTIAIINESHKVTRARFDELSAAIKVGDLPAQCDHVAWLTTDKKALLSHAIKANARMHPTKRASLEGCLNAPGMADMSKPIAEHVEMYAKPKTGGFRVIHEFSIVHRAIQFGVQQVGSRYFTPKPFQYTHKGVPEAIRAVKTAIMSGHLHVAEIDIKRFYGSFREDRLLKDFAIQKAVELPEGVVKYAVFSRHYEAGWKKGGLMNVPYSLLSHLNKEARSGLSTGSGCSPIIAMITVSKLAWQPMPSVFLVNYLDNFLLLALSKTMLEEAIEELMAAIGQLPGGHFDAKEVFCTHASHGFDFLGHQLQLSGGLIHVEPTQANFHDFCAECDRLDTKMGDCLFYLGHQDLGRGISVALDELDYVCGFIAAFRECDAEGLDFYESQIDDIIASLYRAGVSYNQIEKAAQERGAFQTKHRVYRR